jgi:hypothetical protein
MLSSTAQHKKTAPFLIIFLITSLIAFALDQHYDGFSSNCPICHAQYSFNGGQKSFTVIVHPTIAHHDSVEKLFGITISVSLPFENKAPPELPHN